ncbi:unnamed protein product [Bursaphelenchus xylophilus]|uniref:(pine wood nematode) hypothetical protein n=1 Tax=Bursaphelenchus xylophilus TaxID=6326 RepID=A0A1I7S3A5_BURXY|nr:unnamed protein product [Bursaphelenchus xylophilus]CAG9116172.1 unnamed protein product [Bursaphelenchus xylophilus]
MCLWKGKKQKSQTANPNQLPLQLGLNNSHPITRISDKSPDKKEKKLRTGNGHESKEKLRRLSREKPKLDAKETSGMNQVQEKQQSSVYLDKGNNEDDKDKLKDCDGEQFENGAVPQNPPSDDDTLKGVGHEMPKFET